MILPISGKVEYTEPVCRLVVGKCDQLWNSDWISSSDLKSAADGSKIIDTKTRDEIAPVIPLSEVELFLSKAAKGYY